MIYKDSNANLIENIKDWENYIFKATKKEKHWKVGRSAYSIADFMMNKDGEKILKDLISDLLSEEVVFEKAIPELEVRFDKYGHGREHDLGIYGNTITGKKIFIGIESKVDESFNEKISEVYLKAKSKELSGVSTNTPQRIEELLKRNFQKITPDKFELRYQLLYSTISTIAVDSDISILLIIVFKTHEYDEIKGIENYKDYIQFIKESKSNEIKCKYGLDAHEIELEEKKLYSIYMNI
jgi:hypothetical protein